MQTWNTQTFNKHTFPAGEGTLPLADEKMISLPKSLATALLARSCVAQSNIHFCKMPMWMPLVACGFPQRPVLVIYQHQQSHMRARKTSFQRFKKIRDRQQLVRAIHLRHVGPWSLESASRTTKHALQAICIAKTQTLESDKAEQRHE